MTGGGRPKKGLLNILNDSGNKNPESSINIFDEQCDSLGAETLNKEITQLRTVE